MSENKHSITGLSPIEIDNLIKDLEKYYSVDCLEDLVIAQSNHVARLQLAIQQHQQILDQRYRYSVRQG